MLRILAIVLVALLCVAAAKPIPREPTRPAPPKPMVEVGYYKIDVGSRFPAFRARDLQRKAVSSDSLVGNYTLVNFFFADCAICIAEIPSLNDFAGNHPETRVLAVTFDEPKVARRFAAKRDFHWPIVASGMPLVEAVGVIGFPLFVLVGPDGRVLAIAPSIEIGAPKKHVDESSLAAWVAKHSKRMPNGH